jgi:hypothetical protein
VKESHPFCKERIQLFLQRIEHCSLNSWLNTVLAIFFSVTQQPKSILDRLIVEVYRSHTIRQTHPVGLLWASVQFVAESATYTTHNRQKRRTSMPSAVFEPAIPAAVPARKRITRRTATILGLLFLIHGQLSLFAKAGPRHVGAPLNGCSVNFFGLG